MDAPVDYRDFSVVFAGSGRIDVYVTLTPKDECAAFHDFEIRALFFLHFMSIILSIR